MRPMMYRLPNLLTLSRIIAIPVVIGAFYLPGTWANWVAVVLFTLAGLTDLLDGYLARSWNQTSKLGRFLDPVADKLLVASTLLMLAHVGWIDGWSIVPALVILCREIMVSGLREFLAELKVGLPVSRLAKWKTTIQMVAIGVLIFHPAGADWLHLHAIGIFGIWVAAGLTLITGYDYLRAGLRHITAEEAAHPPERPTSRPVARAEAGR
jgi:cardiolipin synthase (CMP-forming)